jgi:hypothetical protein
MDRFLAMLRFGIKSGKLVDKPSPILLAFWVAALTRVFYEKEGSRSEKAVASKR